MRLDGDAIDHSNDIQAIRIDSSYREFPDLTSAAGANEEASPHSLQSTGSDDFLQHLIPELGKSRKKHPAKRQTQEPPASGRLRPPGFLPVGNDYVSVTAPYGARTASAFSGLLPVSGLLMSDE